MSRLPKKETLERRRRLRAGYLTLYKEIEALLFRHDPIRIALAANKDEYDPEVGTILPRLSACASPEDATRVVHEEFVHWFGPDLAGDRGRYSDIGREVWEVWQGFRKTEQGGPATPPGDSTAL
jgi:hypothetical protein